MTNSLKVFADTFSREADAIEAAFHASAQCSVISEYKVAYIPAIEGCITALWDAWSRFNRTVLLNSANGPIQGTSGTIYTPTQSRTENQAIRKLASDSRRQSNRIKLSGGEPVWSGPEMLLDVCQSLELPSNHPLHAAVTSATLSLPYNISIANPIPEIRSVRNFCAHKGDKTYLVMGRYFRPGVLNTQIHTRQKVSGISRFSHWVDCLKVIADAGCS
ncbi:hypothetical protein ACFWNW_00360 [Streptomyces seoulensis]|uniref:hypothetical protein n=1 Tax=Streptomyces seoulensis TaxID=73044 RepID=UPI00365B9E65